MWLSSSAVWYYFDEVSEDELSEDFELELKALVEEIEEETGTSLTEEEILELAEELFDALSEETETEDEEEDPDFPSSLRLWRAGWRDDGAWDNNLSTK